MKTIIALTCLAAGCQLSHEENLGYSAAGTPRWAVTLGGTENDRGMTVAFDSIGDVVVGGEILERDPANYERFIGHTFITKRVASDGAERWTRMFSSSSSQSYVSLNDLAVGPQDMIYAVGTYNGTVEFGGQSLMLPAGTGGAFVAAISGMGDVVWASSLRSASPLSVTVDAQGHVYVVGTFANTSLQLGSQVFVEADNDPDVFLAAFDPLGTVLWGAAFQGAAPGTINGAGPWARGLAVAPNGDILVAGTFTGPVSFGGAVLDPQARIRGVLVRYRNDGLYLSSQRIGRTAPYSTLDMNVAVDAAGHIVLQHGEQNDNGSATGDHAAARPNVLSVLADNGTELWNTEVVNHGGSSPQTRTLATTPSGLIVTSAWTDNFDADGSALGSMEVLSFDADGHPGMSTFGAREGGTPQQTMAFDTAVAASGALAFTGTFGGKIDFGTGTTVGTPGHGDADAFIVLVDPPSGP